EVQITGQAKEDILEALNPEEENPAVESFLSGVATFGNSISGISKTLERFIPSTSKLGTLLNDIESLAPKMTNFNHIMQTDEESEVPETLVADYRDIMYLRGVVNLLLAIYDSKEPVEYDLAKIDEISSVDDPLSYFLTDEAYTKISEFSGKYADVENPPASETFWTDLNTLVTDLADDSGNLMMSSLFKDDVLSFKGFKFLIDEADFFIDIVNKVYDFEVAKTDSNGWTDNNKTSLYEYTTRASEDEDISIKTGLDETINPPEMGTGTTMTELKFGAVDMLSSPKYIFLVRELDKDLPSGNLAISTKMQIRPTEESTETTPATPADVSLSITLKFNELRNEPFDLLNNNIGIKTAMIQELIDIRIWDILTQEEMAPEDASEILDIVLSNLTFYDSATEEFNVTIDNGIIISGSVTVPEG
ncbi:MAG TPA: hypothetical protein PK630_04860, partial [Fervidobacterium sp.]|nr:hypothetical protein [Fervidobacterium sp.]